MTLFRKVEVPRLEKIAAEIRLSDTADAWPSEILREALESRPFLQAYMVSPVMKTVDAERRFAVGYLEVQSSSAFTPRYEGQEAVAASHGVKTVHVPVIVKNGKLQELDTFMDEKGRHWPLNETRLRTALFRSQMFDVPPRGGENASQDGLQPPTYSRHYGDLSGEISNASIKMSSEHSLLALVLPTATEEALAKMAEDLGKDSTLLPYLCHNAATRACLALIKEAKPVSTAAVVKLASRRVPDLFQLRRRDERYILKMATVDDFEPEEVEGDRFQMEDLVGPDLVNSVDEAGERTVSTQPVVREQLEADKVEPIETFGEYRVKTVDGNEIMGWVFPDVIGFDGVIKTYKLFTNGSDCGIQDRIVGSLVGKGSNIIRSNPLERRANGQPQQGFFYHVASTGNVVAFQPVQVEGASRDQDGSVNLMCQTLEGEPMKLRLVPGLQELTELGEDGAGKIYAIPESVRFAPFPEHVVPLVSEAEDFVKEGAERGRVDVISTGALWSFRGEPLAKVASQWRENLEHDDAMFLAVGLGLSESRAWMLLKTASHRRHAVIRSCRSLGDGSERKTKLAQARSRVRELWSGLPSVHHLLKEAAAFEDVSTVDHVLSLGFLNPENVRLFVQYLPSLEETVSRLAHLLLASRLGLEQVPEDSAKSAMERLDEVCRGLRNLLLAQEKTASENLRPLDQVNRSRVQELVERDKEARAKWREVAEAGGELAKRLEDAGMLVAQGPLGISRAMPTVTAARSGEPWRGYLLPYGERSTRQVARKQIYAPLAETEMLGGYHPKGGTATPNLGVYGRLAEDLAREQLPRHRLKVILEAARGEARGGLADIPTRYEQPRGLLRQEILAKRRQREAAELAERHALARAKAAPLSPPATVERPAQALAEATSPPSPPLPASSLSASAEVPLSAPVAAPTTPRAPEASPPTAVSGIAGPQPTPASPPIHTVPVRTVEPSLATPSSGSPVKVVSDAQGRSWVVPVVVGAGLGIPAVAGGAYYLKGRRDAAKQEPPQQEH